MTERICLGVVGTLWKHTHSFPQGTSHRGTVLRSDPLPSRQTEEWGPGDILVRIRNEVGIRLTTRPLGLFNGKGVKGTRVPCRRRRCQLRKKGTEEKVLTGNSKVVPRCSGNNYVNRCVGGEVVCVCLCVDIRLTSGYFVSPSLQLTTGKMTTPEWSFFRTIPLKKNRNLKHRTRPRGRSPPFFIGKHETSDFVSSKTRGSYFGEVSLETNFRSD